jgi:hypothetical protein
MQNNIGNGCANYTYITSGATTVIGTGGHVRLHAIVINKATTGTIKIIDAVAGASTTANIGTIAASTPAQSLIYNVIAAAGLTLINSATEDITVVWQQS